MASSKISLKLTIDTKAKTVLFAEVDKDFMEFLFNFLSFHISTAFKLLDGNNGGLPQATGCLLKFYQSVKDIIKDDIDFSMHKDIILKPQSFPYFINPHLSLLSKEDESKPHSSGSRNFETAFNRCGKCAPAVWCRYCSKCQGCGDTIFKDSWRPMAAKGVTTYMVMDDLVVSPMITQSTAESIAFLKKFNIKDVNAIEEKEVHISPEEVF